MYRCFGVIALIGFICMSIVGMYAIKTHKSLRDIGHEMWLDSDDPRMNDVNNRYGNL